MLMKKLFLLYNKDAEPEVDPSALLDEIDWDCYIDPTLNFPENRRHLNDSLKEIFEVGRFTLYPKDTRESEEQWLMQEKGWRILKEQVVKTHKVKDYEYGFAAVSLPKDTVGHRVVLAVLDLTAEEEKQFQDYEKRNP